MVLEGDITPNQANAVCNATKQMVRIAELKIRHDKTILDSVAIKPALPMRIEDHLLERVEEYIVKTGDKSIAELAQHFDVAVDYFRRLAESSDTLALVGNRVELKA